jgi:hypothetical protein
MEYGLTERERKVIEMRYGLGAEGAATLETIGARIGLTRERIRQIEVQALHKLHLFILHEDLEEEEKRAARHRARHGGAARRAAGESPWAPAPPADADMPPSGEPPRRHKRQTARLHLKPPGGGPASAGQPGKGEGGES